MFRSRHQKFSFIQLKNHWCWSFKLEIVHGLLSSGHVIEITQHGKNHCIKTSSTSNFDSIEYRLQEILLAL